jgi:hypothetical protein
MPFNKNENALVPDWTQIEGNTAYLNQRTGRYEMPYISEFVSTGGDDLDKRLRIATTKGVIKLAEFYNKRILGQSVLDRIVVDSLKSVQYYIDPRPTCSFMRVLLSVDFDELSDLPVKKKEDTDASRYFVSFHIESMRKMYKILSTYMRSHTKIDKTTRYNPYVNNIKIDLEKEADYFEKLIESFMSMASEDDSILSFLFNETLGLLDVSSSEEEIVKGQWIQIRNKRFYNVISVSYLINYFKVLPFVNSGDSLSLNKFLNSFVIGSVILKDDSTIIKDKKHNAIEDLESRAIDFLDQRKEKIINEMKRFGAIQSPIKVDLNCGKIPIGQALSEVGDIVYKTYQRKNIEDEVINNSIISVKQFDSRSDLGDFVGDQAINDLLGFSDGGPTNIKDFYREVLNSIDIRTLTNKIMQCLFKGGSIQTVCVEFHNPLSFKLPDKLKIPSIFDFISKLVWKLLLLLVTEILKWLMSLIINELNKCIQNNERGVDALEDDRNISDYFGPNIPAVDDYLTESITDLLGDSDLVDIVSGENIHEFLKDVIALLTIIEFCQLVNGEATDHTLDLIRCLVETKYTEFMTALDSNHKIESVFSSLGSVINRDFCDSILNEVAADDPSICEPTEENNTLRRLLLDKGDGITLKQIDEQIDLVNSIQKEQTEIYLNLLKDKGDLTDALLGDDTPEDFVKKLLPCAEENEPMAHMVKLSLTNIVEPLRDLLTQNMADNNFISLITILDSIEDEKFRKVGEAYRDLTKVHITNQDEVRLGSVRVVFRDDPINETTTMKGISSSGVLNIVRDLNGFNPNVTGNAHKDFFTDTLIKSLQAKGVGVQGFDVMGFRNSVSDVYRWMLVTILRLYSKDLGQSAVATKKEELIESIEDLFGDEKIKFFENMWRQSQTDLVAGVSTTFFAEECKSRDFRDLQKVLFEMTLYLYIRIHIFEFFFKSIYSITEYNSFDWSRNSFKDLVEKEIKKDGVIHEARAFIKEVEDKRDLEFGDFISEQFSKISNSLKDEGGLFDEIRNTSPNTAKKVFINNIRFMDAYYSKNSPRFTSVQLMLNQQAPAKRLKYELNSGLVWNGNELNFGQFFLERYIRVKDKPGMLSGRNTLLKGVVNYNRWQTYMSTFSDDSMYQDHFEEWSYGLRLNILWPKAHINLLAPLRGLPNMKSASDLEKAFFVEELNSEFFVLPLIEIEHLIPNTKTNSLLEWPEQRLLQDLIDNPKTEEVLRIMFPLDEMGALVTLRDYHLFNKNYFKKQKIFEEPLKVLKFMMQGIINLEDFTYENKELSTNSRSSRK